MPGLIDVLEEGTRGRDLYPSPSFISEPRDFDESLSGRPFSDVVPDSLDFISLEKLKYEPKTNWSEVRLNLRSAFNEKEDRRQWNPGFKSSSDIKGSPARIVAYTPYNPLPGIKDPRWVYPRPFEPGSRRIKKYLRANRLALSPYLKFRLPEKTIICLKRKIRREILSAMGKLGGIHRPPKPGPYSDVRCL